MSRRQLHHPDAVRNRTYERSKSTSPTYRPRVRYIVGLRYRDGTYQGRGTHETIEEAREAVRELFRGDVDDAIYAADVREVRAV